tara:strand:+ start:621 stop:950 length:330 start_codon:yes stop_codon:yes gene_type:complete
MTHAWIKTAATAAALVGIACSASAEDLTLVAEQVSYAQSACEHGSELVPVISDYGYDTGEYAIPEFGDNGEVLSAVILRLEVLRQIPECKMALAQVDGGTPDYSNVPVS